MTADGGHAGVLVEERPSPTWSADPPLDARIRHAVQSDAANAEIDAFLTADPAEALRLWFGPDRLADADAGRLRRMIDRELAALDEALSRACDSLLHHPAFQALEAAWRGVHWLVDTLGGDGMTVLRLLDCRWAELTRDLERAPEFDQSTLFQLVYEQEFGMPGGVPFSMLVGLYEVRHKPGRGRATDDVATLRALSEVCAAAFAPIVMGASPALFEVERFGELDLRQSIAATLSDIDHRRFTTLQQSPDTRFLALAAPRVLLRTAYRGREAGDCGFRYEERIRPGGRDELWGSAALAVAQVCIRAFDDHRWLAAIRGTVTDRIDGGVISGLPIPDFATDSPGTALKPTLEVNVSGALESEMTRAGVICLRRCKDTAYPALYSLPTLHRPAMTANAEIARINAQLGAVLNYVLCVSRFAHYLKVIGREWIGSLKSPEACEIKLQTWLFGYCSAGDKLSFEMKARHPLQDGRVSVRETPGKPGSYEVSAWLKPHLQLDQAIAEFQLTTTVQGAARAL